MRTAVFDLDGTLADTAADLLAAANLTLEEAGHGRPLSVATDESVAFAGGRAMLQLGLMRAGLDAAGAEPVVAGLYGRLLALYAEGLAEETRLFDGVEDALDRLEGDGWRLAICTNKPERLAILLLEALGVRQRFAALLGADSRPWRKPDPRHLTETILLAGGDATRAVLIGDTVTDRRAAAAAGIPCVLVRFGPEGDAVDALEPEAIIAHFDELPATLGRLVPA